MIYKINIPDQLRQRDYLVCAVDAYHVKFNIFPDRRLQVIPDIVVLYQIASEGLGPRCESGHCQEILDVGIPLEIFDHLFGLIESDTGIVSIKDLFVLEFLFGAELTYLSICLVHFHCDFLNTVEGHVIIRVKEEQILAMCIFQSKIPGTGRRMDTVIEFTTLSRDISRV